MTLEELDAFVRSAPPGTLLPASTVADSLADRAPSRNDTPVATAAASWRERLWTVTAETRLDVEQLSEAIGRPRSWIYRHTSAKSDRPRLPHRKLDGQLTFLAGEIRHWIERNEIVVERGSQQLQLMHRRRGA